MFTVKDDYLCTWPVKVKVPTDDGRHVEQVFKARFKAISTDRAKAFYEGRAVRDADDDVLRETLVGWTEMVDEQNAPVPFDEAMRDRLIRIPFVRTALATAFREAMSGLLEKN